jgi:histidine triad (HIT) family protein
MAAEPDCVFCGIVERRIPTDVVWESDQALAFRDVNPQAPTHVLVVPKTHASDVADLASAHPAAVASQPSPSRRGSGTATDWCSTPAPGPVRRCSTATATCSVAER